MFQKRKTELHVPRHAAQSQLLAQSSHGMRLGTSDMFQSEKTCTTCIWLHSALQKHFEAGAQHVSNNNFASSMNPYSLIRLKHNKTRELDKSQEQKRSQASCVPACYAIWQGLQIAAQMIKSMSPLSECHLSTPTRRCTTS